MFQRLKRIANALIEPLQADDELKDIHLSIPNTHATAGDGDVGWRKRPPASFQCPRCSNEIYQSGSFEPIDCSRCVATFTHEAFSDLRLLSLHCPICRHRMEYGIRHPNAFDVPEWATCHNCYYHWEYIDF